MGLSGHVLFIITRDKIQVIVRKVGCWLNNVVYYNRSHKFLYVGKVKKKKI